MPAAPTRWGRSQGSAGLSGTAGFGTTYGASGVVIRGWLRSWQPAYAASADLYQDNRKVPMNSNQFHHLP